MPAVLAERAYLLAFVHGHPTSTSWILGVGISEGARGGLSAGWDSRRFRTHTLVKGKKESDLLGVGEQAQSSLPLIGGQSPRL